MSTRGKAVVSLDDIQILIGDNLHQTHHTIQTALTSDVPLIQQITQHILSSGGKRIRPTITLLSAHICHCEENIATQLAATLELIHTATLLHDDVVDNTTLRRGQKTAHAIWGNPSSILVGDFLYSKAFQMVVNLRCQPILEVFAETTHYIAEGEILQLTNCHNPDTTEAFYFDIIQRKTAKLFEIAAILGALFTHQPPPILQALRQYGQHIGLAYQLIDDTLDYSRSIEQTGKNIGQDLSEGKMTLPLIYAMQQSTKAEKILLQQAIQNGSGDQLAAILQILQQTKAIAYTIHTAKSHAQQAQQALSLMVDSPYRRALHTLGDFIVNRTY